MTGTASRARLPLDEARALSVGALRAIGFDDDCAACVADHVVDAAACGYEYSGLPKILNLAEFRAARPPVAPIRIAHETPVSCRLDGGGENGMVVVDRAARIAIDKASACGFAVVAASRTWMSGRSAYYVEAIARTGLVAMHAVSSRPQVAPPGAAAAAIGTNPIAFGFPTEGEPLVIDLGTAALMFTDLALRARRGEALPEDVAIDGRGRPTTDPVAALQGAVLSFGGHKGFALALAMLALGTLADTADDPDGAGYLIVAFRPDLLMPADRYRSELSGRLAALKSVRTQPGVDAIRIPSERAFAARVTARREGIEIDRAVHDALRDLAQRGAC